MGDAERGKMIFIQRCAECHTVSHGGKNKTGPNLFGIAGGTAGQNPTYKYSEALKNSDIHFDDAILDEYLTNPKQFIPGIKSTFRGMRSKADRTNVIDFLKKWK